MDNLRLRCYSSIDDLKKDIKVKSASELVEGDKIYGYVIDPIVHSNAQNRMITNIHYRKMDGNDVDNSIKNIETLVAINNNYTYASDYKYNVDGYGYRVISINSDKDYRSYWFKSFQSYDNGMMYKQGILIPVYFNENNILYFTYTVDYYDSYDQFYDGEDPSETISDSLRCMPEGYLTFIRWGDNNISNVSIYFITEPYSA